MSRLQMTQQTQKNLPRDEAGEWRDEVPNPPRRLSRKERRLRLRRRGKRAYIRSVYFLPSLCTLGNAVCGFASMYVAFLAMLAVGVRSSNHDPMTLWWASHGFSPAAYLIFFAMLFDALDGRLARFARHTTDFGGQLDSLADVVSFGTAPALLGLLVFHQEGPGDLPWMISRLIWAIGAMYLSCALLRLARFNVSNEHGEQHHFSFLGLPSPGAAAAVAALVLMQQDLSRQAADCQAAGWTHLESFFTALSDTCVGILPFLVLLTGLLMISPIRYPHVVNRYLRGKKSFGRLVAALVVLLLLVVAHQYTLGIGGIAYALWGLVAYIWFRVRRRKVSIGTPPA
jgi:CDP-diacylglycerol--serine O-phosphatidyltransferase